MAVQAQLHHENFGLVSSMPGLQDWMTIPMEQNAQSLAYASPSSSSSSTCNHFLPMELSQSLYAQLEVQKQELDCILHLQNERLKYVLREQSKMQLANELKCMESNALYLMKQKEQDLARATKRRMELEACLMKAETESSSWERLAKANEATVTNLSNALERAQYGLIGAASNTAEDAGSLCCNDQEEEEKSSKRITCKHCNSRTSCVLFLPCRHLCSCTSCEAALDSCPVCKSVKEASLKVFWV